MITVSHIEETPSLPAPRALTIGSFDGLHLGHLSLLRELRRLATDKGSIAVFTFANHPAQILKNRPPTPFLSTQKQKLLLLEKAGVNLVILQEFTPDFAAQAYEQFLQKISAYFPFSHLVLGEGATLGKNRQGDEKAVSELGEKCGFEAHYLRKASYQGLPISSGRIRSCIQQGNLQGAAELLGRPYSLFGPFYAASANRGSFSLENLCSLPKGRYVVEILYRERAFPALAEIGEDPLKMSLEIPSCPEDLSEKNIEIVFKEKVIF